MDQNVRIHLDLFVRISGDIRIRTSEYIRTALSGYLANKSRADIGKFSRFSIVGNQKLLQTKFEKPNNTAGESMGGVYDLDRVSHVATRQTLLQERAMYRLNSLNGWYHGMSFASLREAKEKADLAASAGVLCDVHRDIDRDHYRVIYSGPSGHMPAIVGTYPRV